MALVKVVEGSRGVATHNLFSVDLCRHLDVLTNRQAEHIIFIGQSEAITMSREFREILRTQDETYTAVLGEV